MARRSATRRSMDSDTSSTSSPERGMDDDNESFTELHNDSVSSLSVSLEDMDLDEFDYEMQRRVSPISRLPAELLIAVFSRLANSTDLLNCLLVSKSWARNSVDLLWHRPVTNRWKSLVSVVQTVRKPDGFFAYHDLIKRLNLGQLKTEVSDGVLQPLSLCKRIERLTLPGCNQLTDMSVVPMIEGNRSLMAIDLSELEHITDRSMHTIAKNCYRLQGLNITNCKAVTDDSLVEVAKNCRRLKRLKLNDCSSLTDYSITTFADHCHEMLEIDLFKCGHITDLSVTALIRNGRQLRELRLAQCSRITDEAFLQLSPELRYESLRILDLTDCNEVQDAALQRIVQIAPRLRNLVLAKCRNITDRGVMAITKLGKNLHFLHLGHCSLITDVGVEALIKYCNRIRYIDFSCCHNLTDESVSMLANLPKLKRIGLVKCANITDLSIRSLARPKQYDSRTFIPNSLERLHLSYCTNLTIRGIRNLLINCPQLTHLSLTGVTPFLTEELLQFCRDAPNEFNEHQRDVFCVFSGPGVHDLRRYLQENYPLSTDAADVGSDDETSYHTHGRQPGMASSAPSRTMYRPPNNIFAVPGMPGAYVQPPHLLPGLPQGMNPQPAAPPWHPGDHSHGGSFTSTATLRPGPARPSAVATANEGLAHLQAAQAQPQYLSPDQSEAEGAAPGEQPRSAPGASFFGQPSGAVQGPADQDQAGTFLFSPGPSSAQPPPPTLPAVRQAHGITGQQWQALEDDDIDEPFHFEHSNH